ncbi:MAG: hypothetical protein MK135_02360 [Polyangiaceae bacterium]|nr:hypothetical protein [Polyangiaceae bacterium]
MTFSVDPFEFSRRVEAFSRSLSASLSSAQEAKNIFSSSFPGQQDLELLSQMAPEDPFALALREWTRFLLESRLMIPALVQERRLLHRIPVNTSAPLPEKLSMDQILSQRFSPNPQLRQLAFRAWEGAEGSLSELRLAQWQRRREISLRLDEEQSPWLRPEEKAFTEFAQKVLKETEVIVDELYGADPAARSWAETAAEASDGWPARLIQERLMELFPAPHFWGAGTRFTVALPERRVPASFLLAGRQLGEQLSFSSRARGLPFVLRFNPWDEAQMGVGYLFSGWLSSRGASLSVLRVGERRLHPHLRALALAQLAHFRRRAAHLLPRCFLLESGENLVSELGRVNHLHWGQDMAPSTSLSRSRVELGALQRFSAYLLAQSQLNSFVEEFDEDWLLNPRGAALLKALLEEPELGSFSRLSLVQEERDIEGVLNSWEAGYQVMIKRLQALLD